ncbi:MAG: hypothetical protein R3B84_09555 [Zavarzinella sp.]
MAKRAEVTLVDQLSIINAQTVVTRIQETSLVLDASQLEILRQWIFHSTQVVLEELLNFLAEQNARQKVDVSLN